jgi:nucleoside-diphosphate-sugar epimerase
VIKTVGRDPQRKLPSWASWDGRSCAARFDASRARQRLGWQPTSDRARVIQVGIAQPAAQFLS